MIRLHPIPEYEGACPECHVALEVLGWHIPGMRCLAELECPSCHAEYYGDLAVGEAIRYPMLLERTTGVVHDPAQVGWWADWLRQSYRGRTAESLDFREEKRRPVTRPILLNCLDVLYGHCLLKLLNAQVYLDHYPDRQVIVLVQEFLRWMVPRGVHEVWSVGLPLRSGTEWNEWLAEELRWRISGYEECHLSLTLPHPHPADYDISRFSGTQPFAIKEWGRRLNTPVVTFVWREDRLWGPPGNRATAQRRIDALVDSLRARWASVDFGIVGIGDAGGVQSSIADLRRRSPDEACERRWCRRYSESHIVVGIHGSNMLLPSAHAGAAIVLMPDGRWNNAYQDILFRSGDPREAAWRYRCIPDSATPQELARIIDSILTSHDEQADLLWTGKCRHTPRAVADHCLQALEAL